MWLLLIAGFSFVVPNGLFLYWVFHDFTTLHAALSDWLALAFIIDVFVTTAILAAYFAKHPAGRYRWPWFVVLSLGGTLAFGLALFWWLNSRPDRVSPADHNSSAM